MINGSINKRFFIKILPIVFLVSCNSLPPGTPPPDNQPIISDSSETNQITPKIDNNKLENKVIAPTQPGNIDNSKEIKATPKTIKPQMPDGADAVNYMIVMIATKCKPIAAAKNPPAVLNEFTVSGNTVNDFPLQVWYRLINNSMIKPISNPNDSHKYVLVSNIEKITSTKISEKKNKYLWKMSLLNAKNRKLIWSTNFKFVQ